MTSPAAAGKPRPVPEAVRSASRVASGAAAAAAAQVAANSLPRPVPALSLPPALPPGGMSTGLVSLFSDRFAVVGVVIAITAMMGGLFFTVGILNSVDEHLDRVESNQRQMMQKVNAVTAPAPRVDVTAIENRISELQDQIDALRTALKNAPATPAGAPGTDPALLARLQELERWQATAFKDLRRAILEDIQKNYELSTQLVNQDRKCFSNLTQIAAGLTLFQRRSPPEYPPVGLLVRGVLEWPSRESAPLAGAWALPICPRQRETFTDQDLEKGIVWASSYDETITPLVSGMPPRKPIAWDRQPVHDGSRHVLFFDGHVELVPEIQFQQLLVQYERR